MATAVQDLKSRFKSTSADPFDAADAARVQATQAQQAIYRGYVVRIAQGERLVGRELDEFTSIINALDVSKTQYDADIAEVKRHEMLKQSVAGQSVEALSKAGHDADASAKEHRRLEVECHGRRANAQAKLHTLVATQNELARIEAKFPSLCQKEKGK